MNLKATKNYISLGYITYNQVPTWEKKDLYMLIMTNETPLGNTRRVYQEIELMALDLEDHHETLVLNVMNIKHNIILEISWLEDHNLEVN
jgi:hypothetical protein